VACVLRAIGAGFDVASFLAESPFRPDAVYRKGDRLFAAMAQGPIRTDSGFNLKVSEAGMDDLPGQIREAIAFLDEHEDELRRLGACEGVEAVGLDFGLRRRDVAAQSDLLPAELLWRAGALDIDITVSHYEVAPQPD
jgi:hypothetical protein